MRPTEAVTLSLKSADVSVEHCAFRGLGLLTCIGYEFVVFWVTE